MTENQDWTVQDEPREQGTSAQMSPPTRAEVDDRGGVYRNGVHDPRTETPPTGRDPYASKPQSMLRAPREGQKHPEPPKREWGEGVVTGEPHDHYVQLANGAVITGCAGGTHHDDPDYGLIPIIATFPAGRYLTDES